jgi:signal transduction histidine kinase
MQPTPYVLLHFELRPDGTWTSPQCPGDEQYDLAIGNNATPTNIDLSRQRLAELTGMIHYADLVAQVPEETLKIAQNTGGNQWANNTGFTDDIDQNKVVMNMLDYQAVQQQLARVQSEDASNIAQQQAVPQMLMPNNNDFNMQQRQSRRGSDLQSRNAVLQAAAQQAFFDQRANPPLLAPGELVAEGVSQPVWVESELLLARRVEASGQVLIQGCWLDWPKIRAELLGRIESFLPEAELEPVTDMSEVSFTRVLAALPAQLVVPEPVAVANSLSPIRVSLIAVWLFLALATLSMAVLLKGVVTLSERRAAFVSAVTHELRTPLTTFRMYAEMLLEGMVTDADQRRTYLTTLKAESDRLAHLVENVLQYARLERGAKTRRREQIRAGSLLDRIAGRLAERIHQADMQLEIEAEQEVRDLRFCTDPSAVEQIMFNLVDNACKYAAGSEDRRIHLRLDATDRRLAFHVLDHGPGIAAAERERLFRPFSKSARDAANSAPGVGLGLALCRRLVAELGGRLEVTCTPGDGAVFTLTLPRTSV